MHIKDDNAGCSCHACTSGEGKETDFSVSRKDFLKTLGAATLGLGLAPVTTFAIQEKGKAEEFIKSKTVQDGKVQHITLLHTTDIHGQVKLHDEFFWENGKAVYKKRGGFAHLKTMLSSLRKQNPTNTLLMDGGDCFQGSGLVSLSKGHAIIPLMNNLNYDLMLPGNWEVLYGKELLMKDMGGYHAPKVCSNMFHAEDGELMFLPYHTFYIGGLKLGFVGYNDPLTPIRQSPAYSRGIKFAEPEKNIAKYIKLLKEREECDLVFALTHMGMAQQLHLASQPFAEGLDYVFGADTHERIRQPIQGKYSKVTEPGAFASFVGKLDLLVEDGKLKEESYELLEVDPEKYAADPEMEMLVEKAYEPYNAELQKVIGKTKSTLVRYFVIETPMDNLIADAIYETVKPDIAVSNGFRFCPPLVVKEGQTMDITKEYLWSMLPVNSDMKLADATGKQIWDWLEEELDKVFATDPTRRLGGWVVRFQGMKIKFTIGNEFGKRLQEVKIKGKPINLEQTYTFAACEREGDPDTMLCRMKGVKNARKPGLTLHQALEQYLAKHSPVSPRVEGRAIATDAPAELLTQVGGGFNYQFR